MLALAVAVEFFHRQLLAVSVEAIRLDLGLGDADMGAVLMAFALSYFFLALLLGRLADRHSRAGIYTAAIAVWSAGTALGAAAGGGLAFAASRIVVGGAQAGAAAANAPLAADYVAPERRGTAMGVIGVGGTLGSMVGLGLGGWAVATQGWRWTFVAGGVLGGLFALFFARIVKEPPRGWSENRVHESDERPPLGVLLRTLLSLRTLPQLALGAILASMALMACAQWGPAFFQRAHGLDEQSAGLATAFVALFATVGPVVGGVLTDRLWVRGPRRALYLSAAALAVAAPLAMLSFNVESFALAVGGVSISAALGLVYTAQMGAVPQALVPLRMRAMTAAVMNAVLTGVGFGAGPYLTGLFSELGGGDADGLRMALTGISVLYLWGALHFLLAARRLEPELDATRPGG